MRIPVLTKRFIFYQFHLTIQKKLEGFQIIEDWAFNTVLTPEEIDKEGVVLEEYRLGLGASKE
jgi:predicted Zn-dependent peptidase